MIQLARLADIEEELRPLRTQLVNLAHHHRQQRLTEWLQNEGTVSYRDNIADYATVDIWSEILVTKNEIKLLEDERDHLRFAVQYQG